MYVCVVYKYVFMTMYKLMLTYFYIHIFMTHCMFMTPHLCIYLSYSVYIYSYVHDRHSIYSHVHSTVHNHDKVCSHILICGLMYAFTHVLSHGTPGDGVSICTFTFFISERSRGAFPHRWLTCLLSLHCM